MRHIGFIARLTMKLVLRSALTLENEIYGLYKSLADMLSRGPLPGALAVIIDEERLHQRFIEDIIAGRLSEEELIRTLESRSFHRPEEVEPLAGGEHEGLMPKLEALAHRESAIYAFYLSLYEKSKIPAIKNVYKFLVDQEKGHLVLLSRLLGTSPD